MKNFMHKIIPFKVFLIFISIGTLILVVTGLFVFFSWSNIVGKDYYTIGDVEIPSISFVLQEKRNAEGFSVNTTPGKSIKTIHYKSTPKPFEDITTYATYLQEHQDFVLGDVENEGVLMEKTILYRVDPETRSVIVVEIHCDFIQYSILLKKQAME